MKFFAWMAAAASALGLFMAAPAAAIVCDNGETNTVVRHGGIDTLWGSKGIIGRSYVRDGAVGACGPIIGVVHRFSAVDVVSLNFDFLEFGWDKIDDGPGGYAAQYTGFWEWGDANGFVQYEPVFGWNCATNTMLTPNHWARFKIYEVSGYPYHWKYYYDDNNDGTYCFVGEFLDVPIPYGLNVGETGEQYGGSDQNLYDHFYGMQYTAQPNNTGWTNWQTNSFFFTPPDNHCLTGWGRHSLASNEWEIQMGYSCPG